MNATKSYIGNHTTTRRKKTKATAPTVGRVCGLDEAKQGFLRNSKRPTKISSCPPTANGFLKTTFLPKLKENDFQKSISNKQHGIQNQRKNTKTEKDFYQSLSQLAEHYTIHPIATKEFEFPYNMVLSIWDMKQQLKNKVENWESIELLQHENKTYFTCTERCNTNATLYYIPVIPLYNMLKDKSRKKTAQLLLSVCSYLYQNVTIPYYRQENSYLYWTYEMLNDWIEEDEATEDNQHYKRELKEAETIGDLMEQKMHHKKNIEFFGHRLHQFKPKDDFERDCFQLSEHAFQLFTHYPEERFFRNAHYNNSSTQEDANDDEFYEEEMVISMDKYISFFADDDGVVYQNLRDSVNTEFNEYNELQEPIIFKTFDGSHNSSHHNLDFENRLFELMNRLAYVLSNYSPNTSEK